MYRDYRRTKRLAPALIAGSVAIVVNALALKAADFVPLATARGGLLRLIWSISSSPPPSSPASQVGFHLFVGLLMALFYAYVLEPRLPDGAWLKGWIYAGAVWLLNAAVLLPATGEGFAGRAHLSFAGMLWFAVAHTLFFLILSLLYAKLRPRETAPYIRFLK